MFANESLLDFSNPAWFDGLLTARLVLVPPGSLVRAVRSATGGCTVGTGVARWVRAGTLWTVEARTGDAINAAERMNAAPARKVNTLVPP